MDNSIKFRNPRRPVVKIKHAKINELKMYPSFWNTLYDHHSYRQWYWFETTDKIFELFSNCRTRLTQGTGMGLRFVKNNGDAWRILLLKLNPEKEHRSIAFSRININTTTPLFFQRIQYAGNMHC
jgi:hypothetical protein